MAKAAATAAVAISAAFVATGVSLLKTVQEFAKFETALVDLKQVSKVPLDELKSRILDLDPALGSVTDLTKGLYNTISAGVTDPVKAMALLESAAMLAQSAHVSLDDTVNVVTKTMKGFSTDIKDATDATDFLFKIVELGQTTMEELVPVVGGLGLAAGELGVSANETGGALAELSLTAGSVANASTRLEGIFGALLKPSADLKEVIKELGFASGKALIKEEGLIGALQKLRAESNKTGKEFGKLLGRKEALLGAIGLLDKGAKSTAERIEQMGDRAGKTKDQFEEWKKTLEAWWEITKNKVSKAMVTIGDKLAPQLKESIKKVSESFANLGTASGVTLDDIGIFFGWMIDSAAKMTTSVTDSLTEIKNGMDGVATDSETMATRFGESIKKMTDGWAEFKKGFKEGEAVAGSSTNIIGQAFKWLALGNKQFFEEFSKGWLENEAVADSTANQIGQTMNWLSLAFDPVIEGVGAMKDEVATGFKEIREEARGTAPKIQSEFIDKIAESFAGLAREFEENGKVSTQSINKISVELENLSTKVVLPPEVSVNITPAQMEIERLKALGLELENKFKGLNLKVTVSEDGKLELSNLKSSLESPEWDAALAKNFKLETADAKEAAKSLKSVIEDNIPKETTTVIKADVTDVTQKIEETKTVLISATDEFVKQHEKLLKPFRDAAGKLPAELTKALDAGKKVLVTQSGFIISETAATMEAAANREMPKVADAIKAPIAELPEWMGDTGEESALELFDRFSKSLDQNTSIPIDALTDFKVKILNALERNPEAFQNAMLVLMKAMERGIELGIPDLDFTFHNALKTLSNKVPHSPVKEGPLKDLDKWGANIINSIIKGIEDTTPKLKTAMDAALDVLPKSIEIPVKLDLTGLSASVKEANKIIDRITTKKTVVIEFLTKASPLRPFHEGMAAIFDTMNAFFDFPKQRTLTLGYKQEAAGTGGFAGQGFGGTGKGTGTSGDNFGAGDIAGNRRAGGGAGNFGAGDIINIELSPTIHIEGTGDMKEAVKELDKELADLIINDRSLTRRAIQGI